MEKKITIKGREFTIRTPSCEVLDTIGFMAGVDLLNMVPGDKQKLKFKNFRELCDAVAVIVKEPDQEILLEYDDVKREYVRLELSEEVKEIRDFLFKKSNINELVGAMSFFTGTLPKKQGDTGSGQGKGKGATRRKKN